MKHPISLFLLILPSCFIPSFCEYYPSYRRIDYGQHAGNAAQKYSSCEMGSCYPATGNLLIGREKNLTATSTCGLYSRERYCIVSHLEPKKCFMCDSRPGLDKNSPLSHRIENIIYSNYPEKNIPSWWQSENGKEHVSIRLDLEAEFHFTHLIMKFRTFRPRAMLIERSSDKGKTWKVYRYFAENCDDEFPGAPKQQTSLTEPICDSRYSGAEPSNHGEVILRVISPSLQRPFHDPYSPQLQGLLKMTNLRINFTKLQTLGDDLVDTRDEIKEKYYYAVKEMTVRGSCWCYGHAQSCVPVEGVPNKKDMVHGRCNCTHNTQGLNCEECADGYNDVPWSPAIGQKANACRACNCNNHSDKCEFNEEVYKKSGRVSGGVCINCKHNTKGKNCEQCKEFYYLHPYKEITDHDACIPCQCDLGGSADGGLCDPKTDEANGLDAGRCHCKANVQGRYCDECKPGFWNFDPANPDGCSPCSCDPRGTIDGSNICDVFSGECPCKANVTGTNCDQCLSEHWGLSVNTHGCEPCDCATGGSLFTDCDMLTGACICQKNIVGRRCDTLSQGFYVPTPENVYEAEFANCLSGDCKIEMREPPRNGETPWTGLGYNRVYDDTTLEFNINDIKKTNEYDIIIRYEPQVTDDWSDAQIILERDGPVDSNDNCANYQLQDDKTEIQLSSERMYTESRTLCLEAGKDYRLTIKFTPAGSNQVQPPTASILIDSIVLIPRMEALPYFKEQVNYEDQREDYERRNCEEELFSPLHKSKDPDCAKYHYSISVVISEGAYECECDPTGSTSSICATKGGKCGCKPNVVGRTCNMCAQGTYGFGPLGCKPCDCDSVGAYNNFCNGTAGQCACKPGTYGRTCGECEPGFWNFPNCQPCDCNGHAHLCDSYTGECKNCEDNTAGHNCERCKEGFYGEANIANIGSGIQCKPCQCPGTIESGHSFAPTCILNPTTQDVVCQCNEGYTGPRCDMCDDNYFGSPEDPQGSCSLCDCNGNIDLNESGNCDPHSGKCLKCLNNSTGDHCEHCSPGYYGDATLQTCEDCYCDILGTNPSAGPCDPVSGQCPCWQNVIGRNCAQCAPNYWGIARGNGCEYCNCDPKGSISELCDPFLGECECKEGFGGARCNHCKEYFYGDPNVKCYPCECNAEGSESLKCNQDNGTCICREGIGGNQCDICARGYFGTFPNCVKCGECFDNWDIIITNLNNKTYEVIKAAGEIKRTGATGAYNTEFEAMTEKINEVKNKLKNAKSNSAHLEYLNKTITTFKDLLNNSVVTLNTHSEKVGNILANISDAKYSLQNAHSQVQELKETADMLNDNATRLQEKDLKGALELTRAAGNTSNEVNKIELETKKILEDAERNCRRTDKFLHKDNFTFSEVEQKNEHKRDELEFHLSQLEKEIPELNNKVCDGTTSTKNHCDSLCGGAGCKRCGGISCKQGAVGKASAGLEFAKDTEKSINKHLKEAEKTYRMIEQARQETDTAYKAAKDAQQKAFEIKSDFEILVSNISKISGDIDDHVRTKAADPQDIRQISEEVLGYSMPEEPEKIRELTSHINDKIASLKNIDKIIEETKGNQMKAKEYKQKAESAKSEAEKIKQQAEKVQQELNSTKAAQDNVNDIIQQANQNMDAAKKDLAQISSELAETEALANSTESYIENLGQRQKKLNTIFLKNDHDAKQANEETTKVIEQVASATAGAANLTKEYAKVNNTLNNKSKSYHSSKMRAQKLFERAQALSGTAKMKMKELRDYSTEYEKQEETLIKFAADIKDLLSRMNNYASNINSRSEYYRSCNN